MSVSKILENWEDYDDKKKKKGDANFFACTEDWEVEYLLDKIQRVYPGLSRGDIKAAIASCCKQVGSPRPRREFVECVYSKLF